MVTLHLTAVGFTLLHLETTYLIFPAVFIANSFLFGFGIEAYARGMGNKETCEYPLGMYVGIQLALIALIQMIAPLCLVLPKKAYVMSPFISLPALLFQWMWLLLGWVWTFSASSCEFDAPYLYTGVYWLVVSYTVAIPLETIWYVRIYYVYFKNYKLARHVKKTVESNAQNGENEGLLSENSV